MMYSNCRYEVFVWFSSPRKHGQYVAKAVRINSLKCSFFRVARWVCKCLFGKHTKKCFQRYVSSKILIFFWERSSLTCDLGSLSLLSNRADSLMTSVPSKVRKCAELPEHLRSEISFSRTCNIPNLLSCIHRIALSKRSLVACLHQGVKHKLLRGPIRTYEATRGPHYDAGTTMAVPEPYKKQLLHFISCEMYRELYANHY